MRCHLILPLCCACQWAIAMHLRALFLALTPG
jgi:hypothetical protein